MTDIPTRLGDRYELGAVLGRGGMAEVHEGQDLRLGRKVAIKMLRVDLARDHTFQARFRREAQSAASLNHPSIVAVYDTGEDFGADGASLPYIVMEHVEGDTLRELLNSGRRLLPERALEIAAGVLDALDYSHRHGIVHRDIKPANVMLTRSGDVKVMDFGIARAVADASATMTQTSAVIGTAQYLSPEQARGETVDARSDLYSAGCLLYELLAGRPPFVGDSPVSVAYQHVREEPQPPSAYDPEVPPAADAIVLKALTKDRELRYQTAGEMRADINRALAGRPVEATPAEHTQRIAAVPPPEAAAVVEEPPRRKTWVWVLLTLAVVALLVGAAVLVNALTSDEEPLQTRVPTLANLTEAQARDQLTAANLVVGDVTRRPDQVEEGRVISSDPAGGASVPEQTRVNLVISEGPQETRVPTLAGLSLTDARAQLIEAQLQVGDIEYVDSSQNRNQVLEAEPEEGSAQPAGTAVNLTVASGNQTVPDVRGATESEARAALENAGFAVEVEERESADADPGTVVSQTPEAEASQRLDSVVTIFVAVAPPVETPEPEPTPTAPATPPATTPPADPEPTPQVEAEGEG